jgi:DNA repair protein RadC
MKKYPKQTLTIKSWAEEDRPREKLLTKGRHNLTDAELIAILLGSGSKERSAVDVAKELLAQFDNDLNEMGRCPIHELKEPKGIGDAKAITIAAALELGRRRQLADIREKPQITSSLEAYNVIAPLLVDLPFEEFWILMLNRANRVIGRGRVSQGGVSGTSVDPKMVFSEPVKNLSSSVILFHNHPSGNLQASQADLNLTQKLVKAGEALEIAVLDHLIVSESGYFSFADEGLM